MKRSMVMVTYPDNSLKAYDFQYHDNAMTFYSLMKDQHEDDDCKVDLWLIDDEEGIGKRIFPES